MQPQTRYARSGDVNIAYQVVGSGALDLVYVMAWVSNLDEFWAEPSHVRDRLHFSACPRAEPCAPRISRGLRRTNSTRSIFEPGVVATVHLDEESGLGPAVPAAAMARGTKLGRRFVSLRDGQDKGASFERENGDPSKVAGGPGLEPGYSASKAEGFPLA